MNKIIHRSVSLHCDVYQAFDMFTRPELVQTWLAPVAEVVPMVSGKYELYWDMDAGSTKGRGKRRSTSTIQRNNTAGCKITAIEPGKLLSFEWKGPEQFEFMNEADPLTHVVVYFQSSSSGPIPQTTVHFIHSGWHNTHEWDAARRWFEVFWSNAFERLDKQLGLLADNNVQRRLRGMRYTLPTRLQR